jgi:hypothetical protein
MKSSIKGRAYDRVILDESKCEFGYLGAKVDSMGCIAFSMANDLSLQLGKILNAATDLWVGELRLNSRTSSQQIHVETGSRIR